MPFCCNTISGSSGPLFDRTSSGKVFETNWLKAIFLRHCEINNTIIISEAFVGNTSMFLWKDVQKRELIQKLKVMKN